MSKLEALLVENPNLDELKKRLWEAVNELNKDFSFAGSLFRSGSRLSYFGSQVMIWADVYTSSVNNLAEYDVEHKFLMNTPKLPHESFLDIDEPDSCYDNELRSISEETETELVI